MLRNTLIGLTIVLISTGSLERCLAQERPSVPNPAPEEMTLDEAFTRLRSYRDGDNRQPIRHMEAAVYKSTAKPTQRAAMCQRLVEFLSDEGATLAAKQRVSLWLPLVADDTVVPVLESMMAEADTFNLALAALERTTGKEACQALRRNLSGRVGVELIGVINALGRRRDVQAIDLLGEALKSRDPAVVVAAAIALGSIGTPSAAKVLKEIELPSPVRTEALLRCTQRLELDKKRLPDKPHSDSRRLLIITGEDYEGHHWKKTTPVLKSLFERDPRLIVEVVEDLGELISRDLKEFDTVVMHFKNYDPQIPGRLDFDKLVSFVQSGGGMVLVHFACGAFQEFKDDFVKLAGRVWNPELRGHDPFGEFVVHIADLDHPVTAGLKDFKTTDELYTCLDGDVPITVLAQATSKVDKKVYPIAFVLNYGMGRVFHCVLGHDANALGSAGQGELFRRGAAWTTGLVPDPGKGTDAD